MASRLRIAHISDFHVAHVTANLRRLARLALLTAKGEGLWDIAARLAVSSWVQRRSLIEPVLRSAHMLRVYDPRNLAAVVQSIRSQQVDHVIATGDTTNLSAASEFREAMQVLRDGGYHTDRLTVVPGNHDRINFRGTADYRRYVCDREYPLLTRISEQVWVVALDTTAHGEDLDWRDMLTMNSRGQVHPDTVSRVDGLLASVPTGSFTILCCHHHLVDLPTDGYLDEWSGRLDPRLSGKAENADALIAVARTRGVGLILFGHRHRATHDRFTIEGIPAACSGSVTEPDSRGRLRYRIFDFDGPRLMARSWITVSPADMPKLRVSTEQLESDEPLKITAPLRYDHFDEDLVDILERRRQMDRELLRRFARLDAATNHGSGHRRTAPANKS
jgi:3',5'-cyclic AMP phosphodiesterase CpdA